MREVPILVTSAHRSSTTFLGNMLALPSHILYVDEPFNVQTGIEGVHDIFPNPVRVGGIDDLDEEFAPLVDLLLEGNAKFKQSELRPDTNNPARQLARAMFVSRENLAYRLHSKNPRKQRYLIKDPMAFSLSEYLHRRYGMQTVIILRHPLSTVASYKRLNWHYDIENLLPWAAPMSVELRRALRWLDTTALSEVKRWSLLWLAVYAVLDEFMKRNPEMMLITHEELSLHPHDTLERLYEKLGLKYSFYVRRKVTEYTSTDNPVRATDNQIHILHRNSAAVIRNWKKILTPDEVEAIRDICGPFASRFYAGNSWE